MGTFKSSFLGAVGFFVPTLILLTILNIVNLPAMGSLVDGLLFSLYFAAVFFGGLYGGSWAFQIKGAKAPKSYIYLIVGAIMGDICWAIISVFWILPAIRDSYVLVLNAIFINSLVIFFAGILANVINFGRLYRPITD